MNKKPLEYIAFTSLTEDEDLVISQIPFTQNDEYKDGLYSLKIWRPAYGNFSDTLRWKERFRAILNIAFKGRVSSKSVVLAKSQLQKLSSWLYFHDPDDEVPNNKVPTYRD